MAQVYKYILVSCLPTRTGQILVILGNISASLSLKIVPFLTAKITGIWDASIRDQFREQDAKAPDIRLDREF